MIDTSTLSITQARDLVLELISPKKKKPGVSNG